MTAGDWLAGGLMLGGFAAAGRFGWPRVAAIASVPLRRLSAAAGLVAALMLAWVGYGVFKPDLDQSGADWTAGLAAVIGFALGFWLWLALALGAMILGAVSTTWRHEAGQ